MGEPNGVLYIRPRRKVVVEPEQQLTVADLVELSGPDGVVDTLSELVYTRSAKHGGEVESIRFLELISFLDSHLGDQPLLPIAANDILVEVEQVNRREKPGTLDRLVMVAVSLLFALGAATAIMNFHADVSMPVVHERIYFLLTGESASRPLWLQIPYSIGVGAGIIIFFNLLKQRSTSEPSPLELEMYLYGRNLDEFRLASNKHKDQPGGT